MKTTKLILSLQAALFAAAVSTASAHISYTGRDFGSYTGFNFTKTITNQNVSSDYGWADATDANLGDTHKTRAFKFSLTTNAWVTLSFQGLAYTSGTVPLTALALPAFSLYLGIAADGTHDGSAISIAWRDTNYGTVIDYDTNGVAKTNSVTEGSLNALGNWKIGADGQTNFSQLSSFTYIGNAASGTTNNYGIPAASLRLADGTIVPNAAINGNGNTNGTVSGSFYLGTGDYSVFVGGANYNGVNTNTSYGIQGTFTAVPEPTIYALFGIGALIVMVAYRARRARG